MYTNTQRIFIEKARKDYPEAISITRKQVLEICNKYNLNIPQWLYRSEYVISRGVYRLPSIEGHKVEVKEESDEEVSVRIKDTYESMEDLIKAVAKNTVNSLIISGGAGLGKSYTANKVLKEIYGEDTYSYTFHSGYLRATHLFRLLWEHRHPGQVIVIDDCDGIMSEEMPLNMLKAALELKPVRRIGWGSEKEFEDQDGEVIPRYFDYSGSIIFLTNLNIHEIIASGNKLAPHLSALESRSLVLDLGIKTKREYMIKINQTIKSGMLKEKGFTEDEVEEIMEFLTENTNKLRELSLRMVEKVAALFRANPKSWKKLVRAVCFVH